MNARHHRAPRPTVRHTAGSRGQALIEMGIVVALLTLLVMGIVEVGFAFGRTNMIVNAARDGARFGATLDKDDRDDDGCITDDTDIVNRVESVLTTMGVDGDVAVTQGCEGTVPTVTVTITGELPMLFNLVGSSFTINRSVTFQDEGRISPCTACG